MSTRRDGVRAGRRGARRRRGPHAAVHFFRQSSSRQRRGGGDAASARTRAYGDIMLVATPTTRRTQTIVTWRGLSTAAVVLSAALYRQRHPSWYGSAILSHAYLAGDSDKGRTLLVTYTTAAFDDVITPRRLLRRGVARLGGVVKNISAYFTAFVGSGVSIGRTRGGVLCAGALTHLLRRAAACAFTPPCALKLEHCRQISSCNSTSISSSCVPGPH